MERLLRGESRDDRRLVGQPAQWSAAFRDSLITALASPALQLGFVLSAVALVYLPTLDGYFHGDDFVAMVDMTGASPLSHVKDAVTFQDSNYYWRPLGETYYRIVYEFAGLDAFWFRVANLFVFLASLTLFYLLALRLGLPRVAALAAVLLAGMYANHVVSVAWISNGGRLLAALFFLACLLTLDRAIERRSDFLEFLAWLSFLAACLSDEVAIAMAPIPVLFAPVLYWRRESFWKTATRGEFYAVIVGVLLPLQLIFSIDDEWRLSQYHLSTDMAEQTWALASQLVLPLAGADPMDVWFRDISPVQWAAGAVAIGLGLVILAVGSGQMRLLVLWSAAALAPFTLWDFDVVSPRYTFLAAFPFAMLVPFIGVAALERLKAPELREAMMAGMAGVLSVVLLGGVAATIDRNEHFESQTKRYEAAAESLKATVPDLPPGTRVVVYYGAWKNQDAWLEAMIRTIYGDPTLTAVNVPPEHVPAVTPPARPRDLVLYYERGEFTKRPPLAVR